MLGVVDGFTREALASRVARRLASTGVIDVPADLSIPRGVPERVRSGQGPEFVATAVKGWIAAVGAKTACTEEASPWGNGCVESFHGKPRDELLDREVFPSLREARALIGSGRSPGRAPAPPHRPAASRARSPTAGTRGPAGAGQQGRRPSDHHGDGAEIAPKPTSRPDHLVGAGQVAPAATRQLHP